MKTILVPTDFSDGVDYFIKLALYLSHRMKTTIILLYSIEPMSTITATPPYALHEMAKEHYNEDKKVALNKYQILFDKYKDQFPTKTSFELILEKGDRVSNIIATANKIKPETILLPQEHEGILEKILGETNNRIIQHVKVPVCIVPTNKEYSLFQKIGYLIDYQDDYLKVLKDVIKLVKTLQSTFCVLHPDESKDFRSTLLFEGFKKESAIILRGIKTDHISFDASDTVTNIKKTIKDNSIDMLVVVNENENMLQRWFTHTTAEKLMDKLEIPVIIFSKNK